MLRNLFKRQLDYITRWRQRNSEPQILPLHSFQPEVWVEEYDIHNRIKKLKPLTDQSITEQTVFKGSSVCNICFKDMPLVWDTVCYLCHRTHCYEHSQDHDGHWFCSNCILLTQSKIDEEEKTMEQETRVTLVKKDGTHVILEPSPTQGDYYIPGEILTIEEFKDGVSMIGVKATSEIYNWVHSLATSRGYPETLPQDMRYTFGAQAELVVTTLYNKGYTNEVNSIR